VVALITDLSKDLTETKNRTSHFLNDKSGLVPPTTHNLNEILAGTIDLARVWDLYGYLIKEV
jgi:hypothetical protein